MNSLGYNLNDNQNMSGINVISDGDGTTIQSGIVTCNSIICSGSLTAGSINGLTTTNIATTTGNNMWGGTNTFNSYIPTTILNPTTNYQLTNKLYVDSNLNNNTNNLQDQITNNYINQIGLFGIVFSYNKNTNK